MSASSHKSSVSFNPVGTSVGSGRPTALLGQVIQTTMKTTTLMIAFVLFRKIDKITIRNLKQENSYYFSAKIAVKVIDDHRV